MKWKSWVGDCRQNLPEGEQQAQTRSSGTVPPPLLPAPEKLSPGHKAEKKKKEEKHFWSFEFCQVMTMRKPKIIWGQYQCTAGAVFAAYLLHNTQGQYQNISEIFLNVNKEWMR